MRLLDLVPRLAGVAAAVAATLGYAGGPAQAASLPSYAHIVVVIEENHAYNEIIGNADAPYLNGLASGGARMTQSYAVTHPSEPNYLALFSGSTQGITDDSCPHTFSANNLAHELIAAGRTFRGYAQSAPSDGYTGCNSGLYARKHAPWVDFSNVPSSSNLRFSDFPTYSALPTVSFVVPNLCNDMHNCSVGTGDNWLHTNIGGYASWAKTHDSLLVVTFDEDDHSAANRIATVFYGAHVAAGGYTEHITHYTVLRTLQSLTGVGCVANSCAASPITNIWN